LIPDPPNTAFPVQSEQFGNGGLDDSVLMNIDMNQFDTSTASLAIQPSSVMTTPYHLSSSGVASNITSSQSSLSFPYFTLINLPRPIVSAHSNGSSSVTTPLSNLPSMFVQLDAAIYQQNLMTKEQKSAFINQMACYLWGKCVVCWA
jgi:hypothetical protein